MNVLPVSVDLPVLDISCKGKSYSILAFPVRLLPLSTMLPRLIRVRAGISTSFIHIDAEFYSVDALHLCMRSVVDEHLGGFCFLSTTNDTIINICVQIVVWTYVPIPHKHILLS